QTGVYAKIGNLVTINARLQFTPTFTTASGEVQLAGLPFPVQSTNNIGWCGEISYMTGVMTWPAGLTSMSIIAEASGSFCGIWGKGAGINSSPILMSNLTSGVQYQFLYSVTYQN
ncbi:MAG TPA: hypothetical protein VK559_04770, partial [Ferruginibacter sp.]|nr:hypothetical protein [Ferruginibacter sp.]